MRWFAGLFPNTVWTKPQWPGLLCRSAIHCQGFQPQLLVCGTLAVGTCIRYEAQASVPAVYASWTIDFARTWPIWLISEVRYSFAENCWNSSVMSCNLAVSAVGQLARASFHVKRESTSNKCGQCWLWISGACSRKGHVSWPQTRCLTTSRCKPTSGVAKFTDLVMDQQFTSD